MDTIKKPHGTIAFLAAKQDNTHLELRAHCHGSALKKIMKDEMLHSGAGLKPSAAVSGETAALIIERQIKKHFPPKLREKTNISL